MELEVNFIMPQDQNEIVCFAFEGFELRKHNKTWTLLHNGDLLKFTYRTEAVELLSIMLAKGRVTKKDASFLQINKFENPELRKKKAAYIPELKDYVAQLSKAMKSRSPIIFWKNEREIDGYVWTYENVRKTTFAEALREFDLITQIGLTGVERFILRNQEFVKLIVKHLEKYENFKKAEFRKVAEFCVALGKVALKRKNGTTECEITIPETDPLVAYDIPKRDDDDKELRKYLERYPCDSKTGHHPAEEEIRQLLARTNGSMHPFLARVTAGGAITILRTLTEKSYYECKSTGRPFVSSDFDTHIIVAQRDPRASVDGLKLCPQSGISECMRDSYDWQDPRRLVVGECIEELRFISEEIDGQRFTFNLSFAATEDKDSNWDLLLRKAEEKISQREDFLTKDADRIPFIEGMPSERNTKEWRVNAQIRNIGNDTLKINYLSGSTMKEFSGCLAIDPKIGVVDFMLAVDVEIPIPFSKLYILDGEVNNEKFLRRRILAFTPEEFRNLITGQPSELTFFGCADDVPLPITTMWIHHIPASLPARPEMAIPLVVAGSQVLIDIFGYLEQDARAFDQRESRSAELTLYEPKTRKSIYGKAR